MVDSQTDSQDGRPEAADESAQVVALRAKLDEVMAAYSRVQQDKDDYRRRAEREKTRVLEIERGKVALPLIEATDELELSLSASPEAPECKDCQGLAAGVRLIRDGLVRQLEQLGVTRLAVPKGTAFDPTLHEGIETLPVADPTLDGKVIQERRAGYRYGDRILRPARVTVAHFDPEGNN